MHCEKTNNRKRHSVITSNSFCVTFVMEKSKYRSFPFSVFYGLLPPVILQSKCENSVVSKFYSVFISNLPSSSSYTNMFWCNDEFKKRKLITYLFVYSVNFRGNPHTFYLHIHSYVIF